jgi:hypothetical protein
MPTPAERIYEAALAGLVEQGERAARFTNGVAPIGAAATAGALLLEPATNGITHAEWPQILGLIAGCVGILIVLIVGAGLLAGADIRTVSPELLFQTAAADGGATRVKADTFHLAAAADVNTVWERNKRENKRVARLFRLFVVGLLIEIAGLGMAVLIRPTAPKTQAPVAASLHLTGGSLEPRRLMIQGELAPAAEGRVRIYVSLLGKTGEVLSLHPSIHSGHFRVNMTVSRRVAPLRSAAYGISWGGSRAVNGETVTGTIGRCPMTCR